MEERRTEDHSQQAWKIYQNDFGKMSGLLAFVYAILLITIALSLWLGASFVILFLLLGVPAIFAAFLWLFALMKQGRGDFSMFPRAYFAYFQAPFRGIFRGVVSLLKSFGIFLLSTIVFGLIYFYSSPSFDPSFQNAIAQLGDAYQIQDFSRILDLLNQDASLLAFFRILYPISYGLFALLLCHFLFLGGIEVSGRADIPPVVAEGTTVRVFSNAARKIRKGKAIEYWKACWFLPIAFILFFALGVFLANPLSEKNVLIPTIIGLASGTLAYMALLPYHAEVQRLLMNEWEKDIYAEAAKSMRDLLIQAAASHAIDEHGSTLFLKRVERLEKALKDGNYRDIKPSMPTDENPEE